MQSETLWVGVICWVFSLHFLSVWHWPCEHGGTGCVFCLFSLLIKLWAWCHSFCCCCCCCYFLSDTNLVSTVAQAMFLFSLLYKPWAWWCSLLHQPCEHGGTGCVFVFSPTQTLSMVVQSPTQTVFVSMVAQAVFLSYTYLVSMVL